MRIFIALDLEDSIRQRIARFVEGIREFAPGARWPAPDSLHVTLKFIGERPPETVERIRQTLSGLRAQAVQISFQGYGFFPTAKSARVFWAGVQAGPELQALANQVDEALAALGIPRENHAYSPHLTLARGGSASGAPRRQRSDATGRSFQQLQAKLAAWPAVDFGSMTAREFFLYESRLGRGGSQYTKIERFELR